MTYINHKLLCTHYCFGSKVTVYITCSVFFLFVFLSRPQRFTNLSFSCMFYKIEVPQVVNTRRPHHNEQLAVPLQTYNIKPDWRQTHDGPNKKCSMKLRKQARLRQMFDPLGLVEEKFIHQPPVNKS